MMNYRRCISSPIYSPACANCTPMNNPCNPLPERTAFNFQENCDDEPEVPMLSLGERILWITNFHDHIGTVRWIGRIPQLCPNWSAGVEFDNPVPNGGSGIFNNRRYFSAPQGHVLFLPVLELVKDDDICTNSCAHLSNHCSNTSTVTCGCVHTCNNYQYVNRHRDSTYGHLKHNGCPTCSTSDYQLYTRLHERAPIYGRISSRRALNHDDHSYERYVAHSPASAIPFQKISDHNYEDAAQELTVNVGARPCYVNHNSDYSTYPKEKKMNHHLATSYPNCVTSNTSISPRESVFIPRATVKFISGLKEWVSCWVLGTAKKKKRRKYVIKGSKMVTSVIMAQNAHSITGERLSSCSVYSDVRKKAPLESNPKTVPSNDTNLKKVSSVGKKKLHAKKRPAPLPPVQIKNEDKTISVELGSSTCDQKLDVKDYTVCHNTINSSVKKGNAKSKENIPITKMSMKKSPKKRRAPLPPVLSTSVDAGHISEPGTSDIDKTHLGNRPVKDNQQRKSDASLRKGTLKSNSSTADTINSLERSAATKPTIKINSDHSHNDSNIIYKNDRSDSEGSEKSKVESISFSSEDSEEESFGWVNNGIATYQNAYQSDDSAANDKLQKTGEVCLKISIQKTETNVMTVEEVSSPSETHADDGSYQSSPSEMSSEEGEEGNTDFESINGRGKILPTQRLVLAKKISRAPREVLKLRDTRRGSVKNLVNAFNMLSQNGTVGAKRNKKLEMQNENAQEKLHKLDTNDLQLEESESALNDESLKSFPTNWQYENNSVAHYNYPQNNLLMPIEEETHTEASEHDAQVSEQSDSSLANGEESGQDSNSKTSFDNKSKYTKAQASHSEKSKACSHCSSHHKDAPLAGSSRKAVTSKKTKRRVEISKLGSNVSDIKGKKLPGNPNPSTSKNPMVCASDAALTALLTGKSTVDISGENKGAKAKTSQQTSHSKEATSKNGKAIMASLYIEDKSSHRGPMPFLVTPAMSLKKLKKKIEKQYKFPRELQCWVFGETFAIQDDSSLASYGVTETGCPILLYVMSRESKSRSLPIRRVVPSVKQPIYDDVTITSSESGTDSSHDSGKESVVLRNVSNSRTATNHLPSKVTPSKSLTKRTSNRIDNATNMSEAGSQRHPLRYPRTKHERPKSKSKRKSDYHATWEREFIKRKDYHTLMEMENLDLVSNVEPFECSVCFLDVEPGDGTVLQECLHTFCKECLASAIQFSETALIKCPFRNDEYSCESHLLEREIKSLVSPEVFERHLQRSMALAESQALDSFHCKTPDCPGWCLYEDNVNTFLCPVCKHTNCVTCAAIHEGRNCRQYQDDVAFRCDSSEEAKKTKEYLDNMLKDGDAMKCPHCQVILMKKWGCDWLKCSMCHTEVCWVTKGPRWGPQGRGDASGGCKCMVNGVRCHPKCSYCH